jgi:hypothetical protein
MIPQAAAVDTSLLASQAKSAVAAPAAGQAHHFAEGVSNFLPTTWRISQFANNRVPKPDDTVVYIDGAFDLYASILHRQLTSNHQRRFAFNLCVCAVTGDCSDSTWATSSC